MSTAVIYSRANCPHVQSIKKLLSENGIPFSESVVGRDIVHEDVVSIFPGAGFSTTVAIDGSYVGNYAELREWLSNRPTFLAG